MSFFRNFEVHLPRVINPPFLIPEYRSFYDDDMRSALQELLSWYEKEKRDLPWRKTRDPYQILVSEIMLQQTRVEAVKTIYQNFLARFPDANQLAAAGVEEVLEAWEGLGYYRRARNLKKACEWIIQKNKGIFPRSAGELVKLPGIGDYTSAAVSSIAFSEPVPVLDGNVFRVISRAFQVQGNKNQASVKREVKRILSSQFLAEESPGISNQALMELGALICRPEEPDCSLCPIQFNCLSFSNNTQAQFPDKVQKAVIKKRNLYLFLGKSDGQLLVTTSGWKNYQQGFYFPIYLESDNPLVEKEMDNLLRKRWSTSLSGFSQRGGFTHHITEFRLYCTVYTQSSMRRCDYEKTSPKSTILKKALALL